MSDLEWYLDVGGKQSGPHAAKEIVEMVRAGKIPATAQVTAARMAGDWVTAQDLIDAYDELYAKPAPAVTAAPFTGGGDPNFTAPPRPTEQLEKSKFITLDREALERTPDPTESLFQAIQAVREKAVQKSGNAAAASANAARESQAALAAAGTSRLPAPLLFILVIAGILGTVVYGFTQILAKKTEEATVTKTPVAERPTPSPTASAPSRAQGGGSLLDDRGQGTSAARTTPPVRPVQRTAPVNRPNLRRSREEPVLSGGARYRDERDDPDLGDETENEEAEPEMSRENNEPVPVDPSQVPADRVIPEPGGFVPGRNALPPGNPINGNFDGYQGPPPAGPPGN